MLTVTDTASKIITAGGFTGQILFVTQSIVPKQVFQAYQPTSMQ